MVSGLGVVYINTRVNTSIKSSVEQNKQLRVGYETSSCDPVNLPAAARDTSLYEYEYLSDDIIFLKSGKNMSEEQFSAQRFLILFLKW